MRTVRCALLAGLFACIFPLLASAQEVGDLNTKLPFDPKVITGTLPNGLKYFIRQNEKPEHRAELRLVVHAGSILEDDDQQGIAHLNEHMAFNGTKHFPHNDLPSFLESHGIRFGAHLNAYTSYDETVYMLEMQTDKPHLLDTGIDILHEWAGNVSFDSMEIEKERGVVGEEWRLGLGANQRISDKELPVVMYGSRYADRKTIGKKEIIDTCHQDRIRQFYKDWYRPDLMSVIAVGDFDPAQVEAQIKAEFSDLKNPANERPRVEYDVPPHSQVLTAVNTDKEMTNPRIVIHFKHPGHDVTTVGDYREDLLGSLYDMMFSQRLEDMITRGELPMTSMFAFDRQFTHTMYDYVVYAFPKPDSVQASVAGLLKEVYRAKDNGFSQGELDRAKKDLLSQMESNYKERDKTNSSNFANEYVRYVLENEPAPGVEYEYGLYQKYVPTVNLAEVNGVAEKRFDHASVVLTYGGADGATSTPSEQAMRDALNQAQSAKLAAYVDKDANSPLISKMPKAGKIVSEKSIPEIGVTEWTLSNGAHVVLKPTDFKADEILFRAIAKGGSSLAPVEDVMSAGFASTVTSAGGLGDLDAVALQKQLAGKDLRLNPFISDLTQGFMGQSSKKDLETLFQLVYLHHAAPRYDSSLAATMLSRFSAMMQNRGKSPQAAFMDTIQVTMSQYNPRDLPMTAERLQKVNIRKGYDYYRTRFNDAGNFTYFIVGSFDSNTMRPMVERYLASLPSAPNHETWRDNGIEPPTGVIKKVVHKGVDQKSSVQIIFSGPFKYTRANRNRLSFMSQALAIKLREDLREDKSGVYGIGVRPSESKYPKERYRLTISFGCDPKRVDELVGEVMKQIDTATTSGIAPVYVSKVRETLKTEHETNLKENDYWLNHLVSWVQNGDDPKSVLQGKQEIDAITQQDVLDAAKQYLNKSNYVQVELLPEKS